VSATEYGLTSTGFVRKRLETIIDEIYAALRVADGFGATASSRTSALLKILVGVFANREASLWELAEAAYNAQNPDESEEAAQDGNYALVGVERLEARTSTVTVTCFGTPTTLLAAGQVVSVAGTGARFVSTANATIGVGGSIDVAFESEDDGPIEAPAGTLTEIETTVAGWDSAVNSADAELGRLEETDAEFRIRREQSLQIPGAGTVEAMRARMIAEVDGLDDCLVFENDGDVADGDGRPPHSDHFIVDGGTDADVAEKIWEVKGGGIQLHGGESVNIMDSQGRTQAINFDRVDSVNCFLHAEIIVGSEFDQGVKQVGTVEILNAATGNKYTVTVNGIQFSYIVGVGETVADIANALTALINGVVPQWVPVIADDSAADGTFTLTSDYEGNEFSVAVIATSSPSDITYTEDVPNSGDQQALREAMETFADTEQTIGHNVFRARYYTPMNNANDDIQEIDISARKTDPGTGPASYSNADIDIDYDEKANVATYHITIALV